MEHSLVPSEFYEEDYKIDRSLLKITSSEELLANRGKFEKYLEVVNSELEMAISQNKTFFHSAFNNIEGIKLNNREVSLRTKSI